MDSSVEKATAEPSELPPRSADHPKTGWLLRPVAALGQFIAFCAGHPWWTVCMTVFILTWTVELFTVQAYTLTFPNEIGARFAYWAPKLRFVLDLLFLSALSIALRRRWLVFIVIASSLVYLGLVTYFQYFLKPLSLLTISSTWWEATQLSGLGPDVFPLTPSLLLGGALAIKLTALGLSRNASLPRPSAWLVGGLLLGCYGVLYAGLVAVDPLHPILTTRGVGRLGHVRGYLGPWFAEWYYLRDDDLLARALAQRERDFDRITPEEADLPIHDRLVIVQAESLDANILDYQVDGEEVTPFLNSLRHKGMYFRVRTTHTYGSSDADFAVLNGVMSSRYENTYRIPGYPYENTTPQILGQCGFESFAFHGNTGQFYGRRGAYDQMGWTGLRFREELERHFNVEGDRWGIRDPDLLELSASQLKQATVPTCHFLITLTTHTPYTLLHASEMEIFPNPTTRVEHYINNMRFLDNCLRDYITSLGSGTTVMIYSDHPTEDFEGFTCDRVLAEGIEYVPCFIYDSDQDLSKIQKTRDDPRATDGTWNLVDIANYLRGQLRRSRGTGGANNEREPAPDQRADSEPAAPGPSVTP